LAASSTETAGYTGKLAVVRWNEIERNPHNPRILFDTEPMVTLKSSIESVGILNPILVYAKTKIDPRSPDVRYVLLDGERRWLCAQEIEKERKARNVKNLEVPIPANIIPEPTTIQNIMMMFNIHQVREPWELTPTALKLEVIIRILKNKSPKELSELTGLSTTRVRECQTLLTFGKKYLDLSLRPNPTKRITGDFFVQMYPVLELIEARNPSLYKRLGRNGIIDRMIEKYESNEIRAVTDFRNLAAIIKAEDFGASSKSVKRTVEDIVVGSDSIRTTFKQEFKSFSDAERVRVVVERLLPSISRLDVSNLKKSAPLFVSLRRLQKAIEEKLSSLE